MLRPGEEFVVEPRVRAPDREPRIDDAPREGFGLTCPLAVAMAAGVLSIALADRAARVDGPHRELLFWAGILLVVVPPAVRLCGLAASRTERITLALLTGLGAYLAKVAYNPTKLSFSDEYIHLRSIADDLASGHLFSFNPVLPEASHYPGLGDIVGGLVRLTGVPISTAGVLAIGSARLVLVLAIFMLLERLSGSARVAGLGCLLYGANPNFLYWSAQVSYESLALPLVVFTLYLVLRRTQDGPERGVAALAGLSILAIVVTHHLSSYFLAIMLCAWTATVLWRRRVRGVRGEYSPLRLTLLAVCAIGVWLVGFAPVTGQYLGSIAASTGGGLFNVITGASATRKLFSGGGVVAPAWERLLGLAAVGLTLLGLAVATWLLWRRRRSQPLMLAPLLLALCYPALLPLRFIGSAAETSNRSTEFLYLGVGSLLSVAVFELRGRFAGRARAFGATVVCALSVVVFLGGVTVAWQYAERLPQDRAAAAIPYEIGASARSADEWTEHELGPGHRFASDFLDHLGLATYGRQRTLWAPVDHVSAWELMAPTRVEHLVRRAVALGRIEYALVEDRLVDGVPASGFYFDKGEPGSIGRTLPLDPRALDKFAHAPGVSRVYDNGEQQIYAVGALK
ncbi:MAG TPA: hypothetical protein VGG08_01320 [Solirubrobacteraceae bacterium]